jgi:hypothetical protein
MGELLLPDRRPVDGIELTWNSPQEDEFAVCGMGLPSIYRQFAFLNHPVSFAECLDLEGLPPEALNEWKTRFTLFLKQVTFAKPGRLLLKSPSHTCRLMLLKEMFPSAVFIHIVRSPFSVIPSTISLWRELCKMNCLQWPDFTRLADSILDTHEHFFARFEQARASLPESCIAELKFEDLVDNPRKEVQRLYEDLNLGDFQAVLPAIERHLASTAGHKPNKWELSQEMRQTITERCAPVIRKYGYSRELPRQEI